MTVVSKKKSLSKESMVTVSRTFSKDGKVISAEAETDQLMVHRFETQPAEVGLTKGVTLNLGNFESARVEVFCRVPSYLEEMDDAYRFADAFCEQRIMAEIERVRGNPEKRNKDGSPL